MEPMPQKLGGNTHPTEPGPDNNHPDLPRQTDHSLVVHGGQASPSAPAVAGGVRPPYGNVRPRFLTKS